MSSAESDSAGWFKSSYSSAEMACVEVKFDEGHVLVRDTKQQGEVRPILAFSRPEWSTFLAGVRAGTFTDA
ncbi:DUF397 domain-containing protein [Nocardia sp. NPDC052566]|uniref:DUF397 domain-containing protein n=1 Tax=Nocardia sp. NPDC052566 TaxID=3364330 RepID=UPI0037C593A8